MMNWESDAWMPVGPAFAYNFISKVAHSFHFLARAMKKAGKSKFDLAVIRLVKDYREANGYTQDDLAYFLDVTRGYIGQIESPHTRAKYNLNQLNRLAFEMNCSPRTFLPDKGSDEKVATGRKKQRK
jgi:DNA-binding XRE family transcriptional regulator